MFVVTHEETHDKEYKRKTEKSREKEKWIFQAIVCLCNTILFIQLDVKAVNVRQLEESVTSKFKKVMLINDWHIAHTTTIIAIFIITCQSTYCNVILSEEIYLYTSVNIYILYTDLIFFYCGKYIKIEINTK